MQKKGFKRGAISMLWLTAAIWGFAFVAQRAGMEYIGPFTYNGIRFLIGSISLVPLVLVASRKSGQTIRLDRKTWVAGLLAGLVLFMGASLQQAGMVTTSAGKAGFITGFYVILVPIIGIFIGQRISYLMWFGAVLALFGLYMLTINGPFVLQRGDMLVLLSAFFWAAHVQLINKLVNSIAPLPLAAIQFAVCGLLSLCVAFPVETVSSESIVKAAIPILYGGLMSVGIAYTLQVVAQQYVHPAYASLILSFETVFAVIGGWLILNETLSTRNLVGCLLMMAGIVVVQVWGNRK